MTDSFARAYIGTWSAATLFAAFLVCRSPERFSFLSRPYLKSLLVPWKVLSFLLAAGFFVLAAPYTGDPTWDHVDGGMMSVLTFTTAPWAVGTLYRHERSTRAQLYVAAILWLLSASWSYDGWLFYRDGRYPDTWWSNLLSSSTLYAGAGMMWSLTHVDGRGMVFDFMTDAWFESPPSRFRRIAAIALLIVLGVVVGMLPFVWETFQSLRR